MVKIGLGTLHIVLRSQLLKLGAARITQVVLNKDNALALDGDVAVKVLIGIALIVLGNFRRDKRNLFYVILGNFDTKLCFNRRLIVIENRFPGRIALRHDIGAVGPRNHTLVNVVKAVLIILPRRTGNIDRRSAVCITPVSRIVRVCILRRVKQVINEGLVRRLGDGRNRDVLRRNHRRTISIGERKAHRCGTLAKARHQTALINGQDSFVGRSPRGGAVRICRISLSRQLKRGELSHRALARDRNARGRHGSDNLDVLCSGDRRAVRISERDLNGRSALTMTSHFAILVNGKHIVVGRSPRNSAACISRISHSGQLDAAGLAYRILAQNRNAGGVRKNDGNVVGISTATYKQAGILIRNNRRAGSNSGNGHGFTNRIRNCSNARIVSRPIVRIPSARLLACQRNRLANRNRLFRDNGCSVDVCVAIARFGNSGGTIGANGSVARGGLALGRGRAALAGCDGVSRALVGLRLIGRSRNDILALRGIASGCDYLRSGSRLGLNGRLGDNLNGNVRVEGSFRYGVESLRIRMELSFLAVDQGLYSLEVIAGHGCNAKDKRCMHRHGDRLSGCRKGLTVVVQGGVGNINPHVYLAICLHLSSSLLSGGLIGRSLVSGSLLGSGLICRSLLGSSTLSLGSCDSLSFGSSLRLISSLRLVNRLVARCRLLPLSLRIVHLLYGLLRVLRCNGLCQGTGSTRRPHGKDQQRRHCCRNDPL